MVARIVIITRAFPYPPGEQFVEPEAPYWQRRDAEVVVMPWTDGGQPRPLPDGIRVDPVLAHITRRQRQLTRLKAPATRLFWREVAWLARHRRLGRGTILEVVRAVGGALATRDALRGWIEANGPVDVVYTYWWDLWTYGAQLLKGEGVGHVVTRAHGYDLYEHRQPSGFLALKRSLGPALDGFLAISRDGVQTALDYGLPPGRVQLAPLGVTIPDTTAPTSPEGQLHLVSTATLNPVKRIDRMVDALGQLCRHHPGLELHWTHFGDGPLRGQLEQQLAELGQLPNLHVIWRGTVPNAEIREHLATAPVDLFVNSSESEGVPVSIMEAMAFGVPALAPAVGGIGDIVPAEGPGGSLLGPEPDGDRLAEALWAWHERAKDPAERSAARAIVAERHDEAKNYSELMDRLVELSGRGREPHG